MVAKTSKEKHKKKHSENSSLKATNIASPTLLRRLAAIFYDALLFFAIAFCLTALTIYTKERFFSPSQVGTPALSGTSSHLLQFILSLSLYFFYVYFWTKQGQTLGMQTWKIKLLANTSAGKIDTKAASIRFFVAILSFSCFGLGYLWVLIDKEKRTWHCIASNTHLERVDI